MGDGTRENPYTRGDVLKLIEEHGGTAEGLDLSEKWFGQGIDLYLLDLKGIILKGAHLEQVNLSHADLKGAYLMGAHLDKISLENTHLEKANLEIAHLGGAYLGDAYLEGTHLDLAHLEGAYLMNSHLEGVYLWGTRFSPETRLEQVDWGNFILGEERNHWFDRATDTYRQLKMWHTNAGMYDIAAKFYYREREAARKGAKRKRDRVIGWLSWAVFGHGEGWKRILFWIAGFILFFALIYFGIGTLTPNGFLNSLYYSAVSFITLGYGSWIKEATGWVKSLGVLEAFLGFFMMTLLLVTFVRKWTR